MQITSDVFGTYRGQDVKRYTLTNEAGNYISVMTLGATWTSFVADGRPLLVHFDTLAEYVNTPFYLCKAVGRVAGRIGGAKANINGKTVSLDANENGNTLHGGPHGFSFLNWDADQQDLGLAASVTFTRHISEAEDHFPGDLDAKITYTFDEENNVTVSFEASSTADTLFNPTNHAYFNLTEGQFDLSHQTLQINGNDRLVLDEQSKLPTGELTSVAKTGYDFRTANTVTEALAKIETENGHPEIDDAFKVTPSNATPIAVLGDTESQRRVGIYSDRNALVVFTANVDEDDGPFNALATEAQTLPDAIHHDGFGDTVLPAGNLQRYSIRYQYYED